MPTIEIASVNSPGINLLQQDFEVAIIENKNHKSHRTLFNNLFKKEKGTIIHIGDPDFRNNKTNLFFANEIIDWEFEPVDMIYYPILDEDYNMGDGGSNQQCRFKFIGKYRKDIDKLLRAALASSPIKKVYLLTDYYFGPDGENKEIVSKISNLWSKHDEEGLKFNTMYEFYG